MTNTLTPTPLPSLKNALGEGIALRRLFDLLTIALLTATLSACSRGEETAAGYIEGRYTYITSSVSGQLTKFAVARGEQVKRGQALFSLEVEPESDQREAALNSLEQAKTEHDALDARFVYAKKTYERYKVLLPKKAIDQSQLDEAQANYLALQADVLENNFKIAQQLALLKQADWTLQQKEMNAPIDGFVFDTYYRQGEYTVADQAVLSLLAPENVKAIFYIPEANLSGLKLGDAVNVTCDGCKTNVKAKISYISPTAEYTPPVIYSNETNTKLIFRIEAEFATEDAKRMHPGQPIYVKYQPMVSS